MKRIWFLSLLSGVLLSIPWLVPHTGILATVALVPLLLAERLSRNSGHKGFFLCHYACFVLWNALTTFWVCNATLGGGLAAIILNALQMSVLFAMFHFAHRRLGTVLSYILLPAVWIAWEHLYFDAQISWPWLVLGNALAGSTPLAQWYEFTGMPGGSLWIWASNLFFFALAIRLPARLNPRARVAFTLAGALAFALPPVVSLAMYSNFEEKSEGSLDVVIGQPNFDPYEKFEYLSQDEQDARLLRIFNAAAPDTAAPLLFIAPETFTSGLILQNSDSHPTVRHFREWLASRPSSALLYGASTYDLHRSAAAPSPLARKLSNGWLVSHNSAIIETPEGDMQVYHKSKLVVGVELTPYPALFVPLDNMLGGVMGRCEGQPQISLLHFGDIPVGCAVCYESVYPAFCTAYVKAGAKLMTVITNDAWWGDTPGYRQHLNFARLRAIELRRDIARCGNTGISAFINQRGDIISRTSWWTEASLCGQVSLNSAQTFFVRYGDFIGRICCFVSLLLILLMFASSILNKNQLLRSEDRLHPRSVSGRGPKPKALGGIGRRP